jgi:PAS domain S-box-containing protein
VKKTSKEKMNNSRFKFYFIITLVLSGLLPIIGSTFLHFFLSGRYWIDEPLHSVVEALGSFTALSLALLILILKKNKGIPSYYMWVSCALIGMGTLDFFHAFSPPGNSFVWLHGMAILIGGFLFAMVWLPDRMAQSRLASTLPTVVAIAAIIFGVFAVAFPDTLPSMVNKGVFTTAADAINILSGLFFLLAAAYFVTRYRSELSIEDFLFANFCLLNGWAGLLFPFSQLWYADWWFWHLLRLIAYFTVILYMFITFQRSEAELEQHRGHLEELVQRRTTELKITNEQLHQEIDERIRAEEELRESKQHYATTLASIGDAVISSDVKGQIIFMNAVAEELTGWTLAEASTKPVKEVFNIINEYTRAEVEDPVTRVLQEGTIVGLANHTILVRKDGTEVPIDDSGAPIRDGDSKTVGVVLVFRDITERKQAEEKLQRAYGELEIRVRERTSELAKANEALLESEASYRELAESIGEVFYAMDKDLRYTYWNSASEALTGISAKDAVGRSLFDLFPELKGARAGKLYMEVLKTQQPRHFVHRYRAGDKNLFFEINAYPSKSGLSIIAKDITERKHAEENISKLLNELKTIFENLPLGIAYLDAEFKFISANKFFYDLTSLGEEDLIGRHCYDTVGEYADSTKKGLEKICGFCKKDECFNTKRPTVIERPLEGSIVKVTTVPQLDKDGNIFRFLEIIEDITERKLSEAALRESEERYHKLVESSPDTIAIHSEGKIVFTNPAGAKLLGAANSEQLIGKEIIDFVHPDYQEQVKEQIQQMKEEREDVPLIEEKFVRLDGSVIDVEISATPFIHQGKHGMQVIIRDITEKKKLETQFLRAQRMESIGTLAGGIAHDINNVLTPIMLSLQLLQEKFTDDESQNLLNILERSTQRGANLVKQVKSFARGVQGERVALQVSHLISEITQIARETFPRDIEIRTDIQKDLLIISGDATQLHQVIMNMCVNARDVMPEGGILSISAENIFIDENYARMNIDAKVGQYVVITISDTGTGISPEILDRIFEPFFTTKQPGKGTGLGLSTSLAIVKSHGGFITVYSEVGKGTAFKVYLPVVKTTEVQKVDEQLELFTGYGELILVVDDEAMVREITSSILEKNGYRVLTANDGKEAIKVYKQNREKIKAILMDMMMPVMDGQACIRALRKINPDIKIIAVSGLSEKEKLAKVAVTHVKAFLPKPYVAKKLLKTIHEVISAK